MRDKTAREELCFMSLEKINEEGDYCITKNTGDIISNIKVNSGITIVDSLKIKIEGQTFKIDNGELNIV